jgi:hypothetical protein
MRRKDGRTGGNGRRKTEDGRRKTDDGRRETGDGGRGTGNRDRLDGRVESGVTPDSAFFLLLHGCASALEVE